MTPRDGLPVRSEGIEAAALAGVNRKRVAHGWEPIEHLTVLEAHIAENYRHEAREIVDAGSRALGNRSDLPDASSPPFDVPLEAHLMPTELDTREIMSVRQIEAAPRERPASRHREVRPDAS